MANVFERFAPTPPGFPRVSPEEQAQRDAESSRIVSNEVPVEGGGTQPASGIPTETFIGGRSDTTNVFAQFHEPAKAKNVFAQFSQPDLAPGLARDDQGSVFRYASPEELATAEKPALFTRLQGRMRQMQTGAPGEAGAPVPAWGDVVRSLPAQFVAGTRGAVANLRRMGAEEDIAQRAMAVAPAEGETPAGAVTGRAAPGALARQQVALERDRAKLAVAEQDAARAKADAELVTPQDMTTTQKAVSSLAQSAAPTLAGIGVGIMTRNPWLAMSIAGGGGGAMQGGSTYGEAREKGAGHRQASIAATIDTVLESAGEALPLGIALKAGTPVFKRIFGTMVAEVGQESATQVMQDLHAYLNWNPNITLAEAWENLKVAALAGGMGGAVYGGIGAAAQRTPGQIVGEELQRNVDAARINPQAIDAAVRGSMDPNTDAVTPGRDPFQVGPNAPLRATPTGAGAVEPPPEPARPLPPEVIAAVADKPAVRAILQAPILPAPVEPAQETAPVAAPAAEVSAPAAQPQEPAAPEVAPELADLHTKLAESKIPVQLGEAVKSPSAFVVDTVDAQGKHAGPHALLGYPTRKAATEAFEAAFPDSFGAITSMSVEKFRDWLKTGDTTLPLKYQEPIKGESVADLIPELKNLRSEAQGKGSGAILQAALVRANGLQAGTRSAEAEAAWFERQAETLDERHPEAAAALRKVAAAIGPKSVQEAPQGVEPEVPAKVAAKPAVPAGPKIYGKPVADIALPQLRRYAAKGSPEIKARAQAEIDRRAEVGRVAKQQKELEAARSGPSKTLISMILKWGGLNKSESSDIAGDKGVRGLGGAARLFRTPKRNAAGQIIEGHGIDDIALRLVEAGWLPRSELDSVDGGAETVRTMIRDALDGKFQPATDRGVERRYEAEMQARAEAEEAAKAAGLEPTPEVVADIDQMAEALKLLTTDEIARLDEAAEGMTDAEFKASVINFAKDKYENQRPDAQDIRGGEEAGREAARAPAPLEQRRQAYNPDQSGLGFDQSLELTGQTNAEVIAAELALRQAKARAEASNKITETAAKSEAERKSIAQRSETADFNLTETEAVDKKRQREIDAKAAEDQLAGQGTLLQDKPAYATEPFYSELQRKVESIGLNAATPAVWKNTIRNLTTKGVKADEIEWSGVNDWLDTREGKVSKQEIVDFLEANGVKVEEVMLGGGVQVSADMARAADAFPGGVPSTPERWLALSERLEQVAQQRQAQGADNQAQHYFALAEEANRYAEGLNQDTGSTAGQAKFGAYQLPGGQNYRELLLTLPTKLPSDWRIVESGDDPGLFRLLDGAGTQITARRSREALEAIAETHAREHALGGPRTFRSSHFDQPNILAHVRFNERTDSEGRKVLFVEEIQSDWGAKGRREGFKTGNEEPQFRYRVHPSTSNLYVDYDTLAEAERAVAEGKAARFPSEGRIEKISMPPAYVKGVPSAPFVGNTSAWVSLALKRMIRYAAENGFDRIAFITGEQSAERYDLSKHVKAIHYEPPPPRGDRTAYVLTATTHDGKIADLGAHEPKELDDVVGKDVAAKIRAGEGEPVGKVEYIRGDKNLNTPYMATSRGRVVGDFKTKAEAQAALSKFTSERYLSGLDLKVGGEGMKSFYDQIVPGVARDVLKKLGGGAVVEVSLPMEPNKFATPRHVMRTAQGYIATNNNGDQIGPVYRSSAEAHAAVDSAKTMAQPGFDITPALRDRAMQGMSLFQRKPAYNEKQLELIYEDAQLRPETTPAQRALGIAAVRALFAGDRRVGASVLGSNLWKDFVERQGSELIGARAESPQDLALAAQILRDPRFETLRVFFTKDGKIVGHTGWTSRLPGAVTFATEGRIPEGRNVAERESLLAESMTSYHARLAELQAQMTALGADGYYLLHNHPSGRATPSRADESLTRQVADQMPGFKGHVVIDHDEYAEINSHGMSEVNYFPLTPKETPELAHDALGRTLMTPKQLVPIAKMLTSAPGYVTLIATDGQGQVKALAELPENLLTQGKGRALVRVRKFMRQTGSAGHAILVAENPGRFDWMIKQGTLSDAVALDGSRSRANSGVSMGQVGRGAQVVMGVEQTAFHGSPHTFDKFSLHKIGTGEGAQAYGWGLYFAGRREVAEFYKKSLSAPTRELDRLTGTKDGRSLSGMQFLPEYFKPGRLVKGYAGTDEVISLNQGKGLYDWSVTVREVKDQFGRKPSYYDDRPRTHATLPDATEVRKVLEAEGWKFPSGRLYEVELAPKESDYLDWDKPLSEQGFVESRVATALESDLVASGYSGGWRHFADTHKGADLIERLQLIEFKKHKGAVSMRDTSRLASERLRDLGVPGIRYLDGNSRGKDKHVVTNYADDGHAINSFRFNARKDADDYLSGREYAKQKKQFGYARSEVTLHEAPEPNFNYVIFDDKHVTVTSVEQKLPDWIRGGSADLKAAASKIGTFAPGTTIAQKLKSLAPTWQKRLIQGLVDQYIPLKELSHRAYILARMTKSGDGVLEGMLLYGKPKIDSDGAIYGDLDHKGFLGAMKDLNGEHDRFFMWVAGNRSERLMTEGREHLFTPAEITAMRSLNQGQMKDGSPRDGAYLKALRVLASYNKAVMDIAQETGLIDGAARHLWEHEFYVPFYREMEGDQSSGPSKIKGLVRQQAFKKLKGGEDNLGDLMANTLQNWSHLITASLRNQAGVRALEEAERARIATRVPSGTKGATFAMIGGKQVHFTVDDPFVLTAISALEFAGFKGAPMRIMSNFKRYLTLGVTAGPPFRIRNLIRDTLSAIGQNPIGYNVLGNLTQGFKGTNRASDNYAQMLFGGGVMRFGTFLEGDRAEHAKRIINSGIADSTILDTGEKVKGALGKIWDAWQEFGDKMENVNRAALYQQLIAKGKSHLEASHAARDMLDFGLQGSWTAVRLLTQVVPFMNARAQGLYKLGRAAKEDPKRMAYVTSAVALASMLLLLAYKDDDDWKRREDWDRDTYWWFRIGDKAFRIPKPFEIGAIGTLVERSLELMISDEMTGKRFADRLLYMLGQTFSMNPMPQLFKPMVDIYANTDSFTGRQIESDRLERLSKPERQQPGTSGFAKIVGAAGNVTHLSPVQIDHMIRAYFGWVGTHAVMTADLMAQPFKEGQAPTRRISDMFVVGDFVKNLPQDQSRYTEEFYKQAKEVSEAMADIRNARQLKEFEHARELAEKNRDKVALHNLYDRSQQNISKINRQIRATQESKTFTGDEKRERLDSLTARRNAIAERAVKTAVSRKQQPQSVGGNE